jgi:hypothetical protein
MPSLELIHGHARFTAPDTIAVGDESFTAPKIYLNVGGSAARPPMPGIDKVDYAHQFRHFEAGGAARASGRRRRQLYRAGVRADIPPLRIAGDRGRDGAAADRA